MPMLIDLKPVLVSIPEASKNSQLYKKLQLILEANFNSNELIKQCVAIACVMHATDLVNSQGKLNALGKALYDFSKLREDGSTSLFFAISDTPEKHARTIATKLTDQFQESDLARTIKNNPDTTEPFKKAFLQSDSFCCVM